jgi:transcriptional regulator with PAS, ATPase and Fis domain
METDRPVVDLMVYIQNAQGKEIPVSIATAVFRNEDGTVVGGVETFRDLRQVESLRKQVEDSYSFADIITKSPKMRRILDILPTIADSESTALITGESGTGKELVAKAIHRLSPRAEGKFVAINCAGIPDTLLEAELFGYEAGAFTGAVKAKPGRFALADGGTLFLDEIGDLPLQLQAKLLRVLQDGTYEPLGGVRTLTADVRIEAATNRDLVSMVEDKLFREDLYYRLKIFEIELPPLRERMEDVPLLTDHFVRELSARHDKSIAGVSPEALRALMAHAYPGNVRELHNVIEHGFVLATGRLIGVEHLPDWIAHRAPESTGPATLEELEKSFIIAALRSNDWNRLATAKQLDMHKTTLFRKIRKLGIELPDADGRSKDR